LVLEGGASDIGIESTIVDLSSGDAVLLRPGAISHQQLQELIDIKVQAGEPTVRHSGGLERHYAPRTPARLVPTHTLDKEIATLKDRVAVLAFSRPDERVDYWLRMPRDAASYAQRLYASLRELDSAGCEAILIEAPPETPEWAAVRDRLKRACNS
jgi:L-threonylcarbamoyladenylate synthase